MPTQATIVRFQTSLGGGITVVDAIASLQAQIGPGIFGSVPMRRVPTSASELISMWSKPEENLVIIENIYVIDDEPNTATELNRPLRIQEIEEKAGAANFGFLLVLIGLVTVCRRRPLKLVGCQVLVKQQKEKFR